MADHRRDIPALAFMNAQVFQSADLSEPIENIENQYSLPKGLLNIPNTAYIVSLLYCLIVIPKELFIEKEKLPHCIKNNDVVLELFSSIKKDGQFDLDPVFNLLRHIRNSLAHANFSISDDSTFTFEDGTFEAVIDIKNIEKFLSSFGADLANLRNAK